MPATETSTETRFAFGRNWRDYARHVGAEHLAEAERGLTRLLGENALAGRSFLDIGCGSGVHAAAAVRLGARPVLAVDLDADSAAAAQAVLSMHAAGGDWTVRQASVFDLDPGRTFDIVYSWGVLHHTGAMWRAVDAAAAMVAPGGRLAIALYRQTPLCGLWAREKRFYAGSPPAVQAVIRGSFKAAYLAALLARGRNPLAYVRSYVGNRGMRWHHDVHDWLGGYPYESADPEAVERRLVALGFRMEASFGRPAPLKGAFGTGCQEYVLRREG